MKLASFVLLINRQKKYRPKSSPLQLIKITGGSGDDSAEQGRFLKSFNHYGLAGRFSCGVVVQQLSTIDGKQGNILQDQRGLN